MRPGRLSDEFRANFALAGYALCTAEGVRTPGLIEVYPHVALLRLTGDKVRLSYKAGKTKIYWPQIALLAERRTRLRLVWRGIVAALERQIAGVAEALPPPGPEIKGRALKAYEDRLDAVVCAYVATAALRGEVCAYGDGGSAIWVPAPVTGD